MPVKYENEIGLEYVLQRPEDEKDPDSFFFSSHDVGEQVDELPSGYEIYEDLENEVFLVPEGKDPVSAETVTAVENELEKIDHLNEYDGFWQVESFNSSIRVYLIDQTPEAVADVICMFPEERESILDEISKGNISYTAYMRFSVIDKDDETYYIYRRMFTGMPKRDEERWFYVASEENITDAASKYLPHLEQDSFYELGI